MSLKRIQDIIAALRTETYRWTPVRRVYIEKKHSSKKRPLGIPTWSNKLLQEVIRLILEAYYEPQFSQWSHGFRPHRGCHTALTEIYRTWRGTAWFSEGDITACFDSLDHQVLLSILRERIHDNRFVRLIENLLKAGYLEDWNYHATLSGSPQGGIVSPVLSNIYLDRLDQYVEQTLLPAYNRELKRKSNAAHNAVSRRLERARCRGDKARAKQLQQEQRALPSVDTGDPDYRRLHEVCAVPALILKCAELLHGKDRNWPARGAPTLRGWFRTLGMRWRSADTNPNGGTPAQQDDAKCCPEQLPHDSSSSRMISQDSPRVKLVSNPVEKCHSPRALTQ